MLSKRIKINKKLFDEVFKNGRDFHSTYFYIKIVKIYNKEDSKFSFVVPNKVSKKAADRIRLKRRGFKVIKDIIKNVKPSFICIIFVKKGAEKLKPAEFKNEIILLFKKAEILCNIV